MEILLEKLEEAEAQEEYGQMVVAILGNLDREVLLAMDLVADFRVRQVELVVLLLKFAVVCFVREIVTD